MDFPWISTVTHVLIHKSTSTLSLSATSAVARQGERERERDVERAKKALQRQAAGSAQQLRGKSINHIFQRISAFHPKFFLIPAPAHSKPIRRAHQRHLCVMVADDSTSTSSSSRSSISNSCSFSCCQRVLIANCFLRNTFERRLEVTAKSEFSLSCMCLCLCRLPVPVPVPVPHVDGA